MTAPATTPTPSSERDVRTRQGPSYPADARCRSQPRHQTDRRRANRSVRIRQPQPALAFEQPLPDQGRCADRCLCGRSRQHVDADRAAGGPRRQSTVRTSSADGTDLRQAIERDCLQPRFIVTRSPCWTRRSPSPPSIAASPALGRTPASRRHRCRPEPTNSALPMLSAATMLIQKPRRVSALQKRGHPGPRRDRGRRWLHRRTRPGPCKRCVPSGERLPRRRSTTSTTPSSLAPQHRRQPTWRRACNGYGEGVGFIHGFRTPPDPAAHHH